MGELDNSYFLSYSRLFVGGFLYLKTSSNSIWSRRVIV